MLKPQTFWEKFFQFYLAISSFFSLVYGLVLVMLGVYCRYNPETYGYGFETTSTFLCLIGGGVMFISVLGCCGASCESRRLTIAASFISDIIWMEKLLPENRLLFQNGYRCFDDLIEFSSDLAFDDVNYNNVLSCNYTKPFSTPCSLEFSSIVASWFYFLLLSVSCIVIIGVINLCISVYIFDVFPSNTEKLQHELEAKRLRKMSLENLL